MSDNGAGVATAGNQTWGQSSRLESTAGSHHENELNGALHEVSMN